MRNRLVYLLCVVAGLALLAASCGDDDQAIDSGAGQDDGSDGGSGGGSDPSAGYIVDGSPIDGAWIMTAGTVDEAEIELVPGNDVTVEFDGDSIGGVAACNSYGGTFSVDGSTFAITDASWTEMACIDQGVMALEATVIDALLRADTIAVADGVLTLTADGVVMVFDPVAPPVASDLVGTEWILDSIIAGDSVSSTMGGAPAVSLVFDADGGFRVDTGCRIIDGGGYDANDGRLTLRFDDTGQGCDDPADVAGQQDDEVQAVLDQRDLAITIDVDRLTLLADDGDGLSFRAAG